MGRSIAWLVFVAACTRAQPQDTMPYNDSLELQLVDGTTVDAELTHDLEFRTRDGRVVPRDQIARATDVNRRRGSQIGMHVGTLVGAAAGVTAGIVLVDGDCGTGCWPTEINAIGLGTVGLLAGSGVGWLFGLIVGTRDEYFFRDPEREFWIAPTANGAVMGIRF